MIKRIFLIFADIPVGIPDVGKCLPDVTVFIIYLSDIKIDKSGNTAVAAQSLAVLEGIQIKIQSKLRVSMVERIDAKKVITSGKMLQPPWY